MAKRELVDGFEELTVDVSKTIQEKDFEPLKIRLSLKKMIKPEEISDEIREVSEILENEICDIMGIESNPDDDDVPF